MCINITKHLLASLHLSVSQAPLTCPKVYASILACLTSASTLNFPSAQPSPCPSYSFSLLFWLFPILFLCLSLSVLVSLSLSSCSFCSFMPPLPLCSSISLFCSCFSLLGSVDYFFSLLWTLSDACSSFLSLLSIIKTLPLHHTMECLCRQFIHLDYVEQQKERETLPPTR